MESSYSTLDVTLQDSRLRHQTEPSGPAGTLLDNYNSALTTALPQAPVPPPPSSSLHPSLCPGSVAFLTCRSLLFNGADSERSRRLRMAFKCMFVHKKGSGFTHTLGTIASPTVLHARPPTPPIFFSLRLASGSHNTTQ